MRGKNLFNKGSITIWKLFEKNTCASSLFNKSTLLNILNTNV